MDKVKTLTLFLIFWVTLTNAQNIVYQTVKDIKYYDDSISNTNAYIKERCTLDIYYPKNK
ncbi:alpha/beta hydrolase, partial [Maribacter sp. ANRC-HE7]|nr:alpha/beta hydrolase [Maribacter aquimaris]